MIPYMELTCEPSGKRNKLFNTILWDVSAYGVTDYTCCESASRFKHLGTYSVNTAKEALFRHVKLNIVVSPD